jgi:membrane protease YdiL (CAAX protease family)
MKRNLIATIVVSAALVAMGLAIAGGLAKVGAFIDIPSALLAVIGPLVLATLSFGWNKSRLSWSVAWENEPETEALRVARAYFRSITRFTVGFGVFALVLGCIMIVVSSSSGDITHIGQNLAIALLSVLYAPAFLIIAIIPVQSAIDDRLAERE